MLYTIDTRDTEVMKITWGSRGAQRILQNVINILNTFRYEVAFNRLLGMDPEFRGKPSDQAGAVIVSDVVDQIGQYEPNAIVQEVEYLGVSQDGNLYFKVVVEI